MPDPLGAEHGGRAQRIVVRHAAGLHAPEFPVPAEPLQLTVAADADAAARGDDVTRELVQTLEHVLVGMEPACAAAPRERARSGYGVNRRSFGSPYTILAREPVVSPMGRRT
jgi:hypothetical protein